MTNAIGTVTAATRAAVEGKVGLEALERVGHNTHLKGVVHEVLVKDVMNASPASWLNGEKTILSGSTTAVRDDLLTMKGGQIIGRYQLKDTPASIHSTIRQVQDKHYVGTKLMGTEETVTAYQTAVANGVKQGKQVTQTMHSTGISSADTSRIASQTIGKSAGKPSAAAMGKLAVSSAKVGGALSGGVEAISSGVQLAKGEITGGEFVANVTKEAAGGGLSAAAGSLAASKAAVGAASLLAATSAPAWIPAAVGVGAAIAVGSAVKSLWNRIFW